LRSLTSITAQPNSTLPDAIVQGMSHNVDIFDGAIRAISKRCFKIKILPILRRALRWSVARGCVFRMNPLGDKFHASVFVVRSYWKNSKDSSDQMMSPVETLQPKLPVCA